MPRLRATLQSSRRTPSKNNATPTMTPSRTSLAATICVSRLRHPIRTTAVRAKNGTPLRCLLHASSAARAASTQRPAPGIAIPMVTGIRRTLRSSRRRYVVDKLNFPRWQRKSNEYIGLAPRQVDEITVLFRHLPSDFFTIFEHEHDLRLNMQSVIK